MAMRLPNIDAACKRGVVGRTIDHIDRAAEAGNGV